MEFIRRFHDPDDLDRLRERLRDKGIPTYVAQGGSRAARFWSLFACIDEQADDARRVLRDPAHEPAYKVDAKAFEATLQHQDTSLLARWATIVAIAVFLGFAALMLLVVRLS